MEPITITTLIVIVVIAVGVLISLFVPRKSKVSESYEPYSLKSLWDTQIQTLAEKGCPNTVLEKFKNKKEETLSKAVTLTSNNHLPFLLVVPKQQWNIKDQMKALVYKSNTGRSWLNEENIRNVVSGVPSEPYTIFDIEDGAKYRGTSPRKAQERIENEGRSPLTVEECIALALHTPVLQDHYLDCTGSRYGGGVPGVCLGGDDVPGLGWGSLGGTSGRWGSPSCRRT